MAAPDVPANYSRFFTDAATAQNVAGSIFNGQVFTGVQFEDLPNAMFQPGGYPVIINGYMTGFLSNVVDGSYTINEYNVDNDTYTPRIVSVANQIVSGYKVGTVAYKYYPINAGGNIVMNDANSFETIDEVINYLNIAPGNPFTEYAQIARITFVDS